MYSLFSNTKNRSRFQKFRRLRRGGELTKCFHSQFSNFASLWRKNNKNDKCAPILYCCSPPPHEVTVSPSLVASQLTWVNQIAGLNPLRWLNFENCESEQYINDVIFSMPLYCKFLTVVVPGWRLSVRRHETLSTK